MHRRVGRVQALLLQVRVAQVDRRRVDRRLRRCPRVDRSLRNLRSLPVPRLARLLMADSMRPAAEAWDSRDRQNLLPDAGRGARALRGKP